MGCEAEGVVVMGARKRRGIDWDDRAEVRLRKLLEKHKMERDRLVWESGEGVVMAIEELEARVGELEARVLRMEEKLT